MVIASYPHSWTSSASSLLLRSPPWAASLFSGSTSPAGEAIGVALPCTYRVVSAPVWTSSHVGVLLQVHVGTSGDQSIHQVGDASILCCRRIRRYESLSSFHRLPISSSSLHLSRFVPIYQSLGQVRPLTASCSSGQTSHFVRRWRPWSSILRRANPCQQSGRAQNLPVRGEPIQLFTR